MDCWDCHSFPFWCGGAMTCPDLTRLGLTLTWPLIQLHLFRLLADSTRSLAHSITLTLFLTLLPPLLFVSSLFLSLFLTYFSSFYPFHPTCSCAHRSLIQLFPPLHLSTILDRRSILTTPTNNYRHACPVIKHLYSYTLLRLQSVAHLIPSSSSIAPLLSLHFT